MTRKIRKAQKGDIMDDDALADADQDEHAGGDYEVGYAKPPVHSQFKKGQSGNVKGPPKGAKSFKGLIQKELDASITVKSNGKRSKTTKRRAAATQLANAAARGDPKAIKTIMEIEEPADAASADATPGRAVELSEADQLTLQHALERFKRLMSPPADIASSRTAAEAANKIPDAAPTATPTPAAEAPDDSDLVPAEYVTDV